MIEKRNKLKKTPHDNLNYEKQKPKGKPKNKVLINTESYVL